MDKNYDNLNNNHSKSVTGKEISRRVISITFSFLLSLGLVAATVLSILNWGVFSKSSVYRGMASSDYYSSVLTEIYDNAEAITQPTGLDLEVLNNVIQIDHVYKDVNGYIDAGFNNSIYKPDTSDIETRLDKNIRNYLTKEGISPDAEQQENIDIYIKSITDSYTGSVQMPLYQYYIKIRTLYQKIVPIAAVACFIWVALLIFLLYHLYHQKSKVLPYLVYSTTAAAFMVSLAPAYAIVTEFYKRINLSPQYFYRFAMMFLSGVFNLFLYYGAGFLMISTIMILALINGPKRKPSWQQRR